VPPSASRMMLVTAPVWEKLGQRFFNAFGGLNIVEASKQLYSGVMVGASNASLVPKRRFLTASNPFSTIGK
jgi:hypothetical protein